MNAEEIQAAKELCASKTWPYVEAFALDMEAKLAVNRHKGDREGWSRDAAKALFKRIEQECRELRDALSRQGNNQSDGLDFGPAGAGERTAIRSESADVGNFCMMVSDVAGQMQPTTLLPRALSALEACQRERDRYKAALTEQLGYCDCDPADDDEQGLVAPMPDGGCRIVEHYIARQALAAGAQEPGKAPPGGNA